MDLSPDTTKVLPEDEEMQKVYQEFLQKCCEAGQIRFNLKQLDSQVREFEKQLEVTERAVSSAAATHKALQKAKFSKMKPASTPEVKLEMKENS